MAPLVPGVPYTAAEPDDLTLEVIQDRAEDPGPGGGAVDSVNGQTGIVVLDAADVDAIPAGDVTVIDVITQAAYDALSPPSASTLYVIIN